MILLCGIPTEPPLAMVGERLDHLGVPWLMVNQRAFADTKLAFEVSGTRVTGRLRVGAEEVRLEDVAGVYLRLMDDRILPELRGEPPGSSARRHCRALHDALWRWAEITPARVVNRAAAMASNGAKPYQAQLIRTAGLEVPETLMTNDPALVRAFTAKHGRIVYKSASGTRSIVHELDDIAGDRLDDIRWCPVQFQAYVPGTDVRVHVVGDEAYATEVHSEATDYRYATRDAGSAVPVLRPMTLEPELEQRCVTLSRDLGLAFSGIDLRLRPDGAAVCFEVNPCPAYPYYERHTGQPIAAAVARLLTGAMAATRTPQTVA